MLTEKENKRENNELREDNLKRSKVQSVFSVLIETTEARTLHTRQKGEFEFSIRICFYFLCSFVLKTIQSGFPLYSG